MKRDPRESPAVPPFRPPLFRRWCSGGRSASLIVPAVMVGALLVLGACLPRPGEDATPAGSAETRATSVPSQVAESSQATDPGQAAATPSAQVGETPVPPEDPSSVAESTAEKAVAEAKATVTRGLFAAGSRSSDAVSGELRTWHKVTLSLDGPQTSETAEVNPFRDYRFDVEFRHEDTGRTVLVPGYYAADGDAAETGADSGGVWRAHLAPDAEGKWIYRASLRTGPDIAISSDPLAGAPVSVSDAEGWFVVEPTDKTGRDHRAKGLLRYVGERYLRFAGTGQPFLKGGAGSPENLLGYADFDNTVDHGGFGNDLIDGLHRYEPHVADWKPGDPTWRGGKGKGLIGALNYLSSEGMNSVYFLTKNVDGDGREVYPWIDYDARDRYDASKLDQWEIVFEHMDSVGLMMHVVTQETENDHMLDDGQWGPERQVYYRELIARFAHHLALTWNLGEENSNTDEQRKAFARYIRDLDPYDHPITVHTYPDEREAVYSQLLGFEAFEGPSMQISYPKFVNDETRTWVKKSENAGRPWVVTVDEMGRPQIGAAPDSVDPDRPRLRHEGLWGNLMAGGGGVEWFFGTAYPNNDLDAEDWRSREILWRQTKNALDFFQTYLPFPEMKQCNGLINNDEGYCFGKEGEIYAVYLSRNGPTDLDLGEAVGPFHVRWFDVRNGGEMQVGSVTLIEGPGAVDIGDPPSEQDRDWVALISRMPPVSMAQRLLPLVAAARHEGSAAASRKSNDGQS